MLDPSRMRSEIQMFLVGVGIIVIVLACLI